MMLRTLIVIIFLLSIIQLVVAQVRATTESGNKVLLFNDGTWQYEEKLVDSEEQSALTAGANAATIDIDSSRVFATNPEDLFYLPSPRLVRFFGESGGHIRCKLSCSNSLGIVKVHFRWEFPVSDSYRYFGTFKEGSTVTFTMDDGQEVKLIMGDESSLKRYEKQNYSMITNASQPLTKAQIAALITQSLNEIEVGWKKKPEKYDLERSRLLVNTLPTVF